MCIGTKAAELMIIASFNIDHAESLSANTSLISVLFPIVVAIVLQPTRQRSVSMVRAISASSDVSDDA